jgi:hypothetical protein
MPYDMTVNEQFSAQTQLIGRERQPVVIVDNYLRDPESMIRYAADEAQFRPAPSAYPGITAATPQPYTEALAQGLAPLLGAHFGVKVRTARVLTSFFGMVTFAPQQLAEYQRLPHIDDTHPGQIAVLHYFCDASQGGTAFYRHRATGYESLNARRAPHMEALIEKDIASNGPIPPQYINSENRLFEQIARFEASFNRLLVYRSWMLHSGQIGSLTKLDPDPRIGRLTTNTFVRFELV